MWFWKFIINFKTKTSNKLTLHKLLVPNYFVCLSAWWSRVRIFNPWKHQSPMWISIWVWPERQLKFKICKIVLTFYLDRHYMWYQTAVYELRTAPWLGLEVSLRISLLVFWRLITRLTLKDNACALSLNCKINSELT